MSALPVLGGAVALMLAAGAAQGQRRTQPLLGPLTTPHIQGCRTYLYTDEDRAGHYVFEQGTGTGPAWMHITGHDTKLRFVSHHERKDGYAAAYRSSGVVVIIDFTVTKTCPPDDTTCLGTWYSAVIKVRSGARAQTLRAQGYSGC